MSMPKILHAIAGGEVGGAETFFVRLALAFGATGLEQHCVIRRNTVRRARLAEGNIPVTEFKFGGRFDLFTRPRLRRCISAFRPDIVLSWMSRATRFVPGGRPAEKGFVHVGRIGGYYDPKYYQHCDHLVCNTEDLRVYAISEGFAAERVHYVPNFVPAERAVPISRATLGTPTDAPVALALGRFHPNKGFDVLLRAIAKVPKVHLWLAGSGPLDAALKGQAGSLGIGDRVHFLGWRSDTASLLAAADVLVCSSRHEPLGNVILEAWSQGTAVVAAAAAGPSSLIVEEESGLLVPVDDAEALGSALARVLDDGTLRAKLGDGGRAAFEASFTKDAVVAQYRALFARVVADADLRPLAARGAAH